MSTVPLESSVVAKKTVFVTDRDVSRGNSTPLGATIVPGGINFSIFSRSASGVELLFFDSEDDPRPARVITIDGATNRTYNYWHLFVPDVKPGQLYGYRVQGR